MRSFGPRRAQCSPTLLAKAECHARTGIKLECEGNVIKFSDYLDATCSNPAQIPTGVFKNNGTCALAPPASQRIRQGHPLFKYRHLRQGFGAQAIRSRSRFASSPSTTAAGVRV